MKWVTPIGLIIIAVAALISILFVAALKPTISGAIRDDDHYINLMRCTECNKVALLWH